jgi:hypothetical protein
LQILVSTYEELNFLQNLSLSLSSLLPILLQRMEASSIFRLSLSESLLFYKFFFSSAAMSERLSLSLSLFFSLSLPLSESLLFYYQFFFSSAAMVYPKKKSLQRCNGPGAYAGHCKPKAPPPPPPRPLPESKSLR